MSSLPLFPDLPDPPPRASAPADPGLPESLRALVDAGVPGEVITALLRELPGRVVCVPSPERLHERHELVRALGAEAAAVIARQVGGPNARFSVPRGAAMLRAARDAAIVRDLGAKRPMGEICRAYQVTERWVWEVAGRG